MTDDLTEEVRIFAGPAGIIASVPSGSAAGHYSGTSNITGVGSKQVRVRFVGGGAGAVDNIYLIQ